MPRTHIHVPFTKVPRFIDVIKSKKLDLEIYFDGAALDLLTMEEISRMKDTLDYNPSLSFHAPFMDLSPGAVDSRVREATLDRFHRILDIAGILGPKTIVFHSGYEKWKYALNTDIWLEKSLLTWEPILKRAESLGIRVAIENIFEDEPSNLGLLMERMSSPDFGVCFDTGHCNLFSRVPLEEWMEALGQYIVELHLHDNDGTSDQHLPIGDGAFDFPRFFELLGSRDCVYTIEAHTPEHAVKSLAYLQVMGNSRSRKKL
ncbi:MAG: sugar phosphate isomerase/epimerase [Nitrospiraceae bacterium]|nr:sugar phosphate isomerase/epimerase [Nitrospiraceae bacterium]